MSVLVGVSGAHGTGKSTVLQHLLNLKLDDVVIDDFSVPRSVQREYGMPLAEIVADPARVPEYQNRIAARKTERLRELRTLHGNDNKLIFADRTPIDFYAYARTWVGTHNQYRDWLHDYHMQCAKDMLEYDLILLIPPRKFPFVEELQRGSKDTQALNHSYCMDFVRTFGANKVKLIRRLQVAARAEEFLQYARQLQ